MGQLSCMQKQQHEDLRRLTLTLSRCSEVIARSESFTKVHQLGQYLRIGRSDELNQRWKERFSDINWTQFQQQGHYGSQLPREDLLEQVRKDCPLIHSSDDLSMLAYYHYNPIESKKFALMGIPQKHRWAFWKIVVLYDKIIGGVIKKEAYEELVESTYLDSCKESQESYVINKDTNRTIINEFFHLEVGSEKLSKILNALANKNKATGYCQGMNYLAALLFSVSGNDYESFLVFDALLTQPDYMLCLLYREGLPLLIALQALVLGYAEMKVKSVIRHFEENDVQPSFWLQKIILSGFAYVFQFADCVLMWDYIIIRGVVKGFMELITAMLLIHESELLGLDIQGVSEFFEFQNNKLKAEDVIRKAMQMGYVQAKDVRKLSKKELKQGKAACGVFKLLIRFEKPNFNELFQQEFLQKY